MDKRRKGVLKVFYDYTEKGFLFVENAYKNLLAWSLQHRKTVIFLTLSVFISSLSFIPFVSTSFFPDRDTGNASIRFRLEEGTRIEETKKMIEGLLADINKMVDPKELKHYAGWIGQTDAGVASALGFDEGPNTGSFQIKLVDKEERKTSILEVSKILREKFSSIPGIVQLQVATQSPIELALRGGRRPISLEIQGHDIETNLAVAGRIKKILEGISGLEDVAISQKNPRPELWVEVDRRKATDMGLNVLGIAGTLRNYFYGVDATEYKDSGERKIIS